MTTYEPITLGLLLLLSLSVGSFIGLFVSRFPKILESHEQSDQHLLPMLLTSTKSTTSLVSPRSHCDHCRNPISIHENIPVFSFILLKGKCSSCNKSIPAQYLIIELATAFAGLGVLLKFGLTYEAIPFYVLICALIALSFIDLNHKILPDQITLPLIWLGLLTNLVFSFTPLEDAVLGAILGYLSLWAVFWIYNLITDKEALGFGDFKLLAAMGAWFGFYALSWIIFIAALTALISAVSQIALKRKSFHDPVAFGPFISLAAVIYLFFQNEITQSVDLYLRSYA